VDMKLPTIPLGERDERRSVTGPHGVEHRSFLGDAHRQQYRSPPLRDACGHGIDIAAGATRAGRLARTRGICRQG
jgi:hypothetical protein